ncbi:MBL fold metallo-hydrolase [Spongiactinospora sp. TRM90649]|uniref:MBL fold metallo-hydrolase n=1 Tax=Spongiactinospora sp. TRM90649 TaxID=3031114 RepID=UPI0023F7D1DB|nr:MBL fold metallo-hydrolase [Spongiactinospora sp. TRM90649]MDF5751676.1 MBL fold metallo-hydrolase [Spongiactinospora sp. TRM90649]
MEFRTSATIEVGRMRVSQVSDGVLEAPRRSWFNRVPPEEWTAAVGVDDPDHPFRVNFGAFLVTGDGSVTLVDSGWGHRATEVDGLAGAGEMLDRLAELGVEPGDVDQVIQTHLHADHCGWLIKDDAGTLTFPRADVYVHEREIAYWTGEEVAEIAMNGSMAPAVRARIQAVSDAGLLRPFDGVLPLSESLMILPAHGHTPGHVAVLVSDGDAAAVIVGDLAHHPTHVDHPGWLPMIDHDPPRSVDSRRKIADLAAERKAVILAPHFPILTVVGVSHGPEGGVRTTVRRELETDHAS